MRYYISTNTNQIYAALAGNTVTSFSNTIDNLQSKTISFMSESYIFITTGLLPEKLRYWKTDDVFFPVALELDFSAAEAIPAYLVVMEESGARLHTEMSNLKDAPDNTVGAFICGEIPAAFISAILFENKENQVRFKKPSTDLWFPEQLYQIIGEEISAAESSITAEQIVEWSAAVDMYLSNEEKVEIASIVNKRNRYKAIAYFALRETAEWQLDDNLRTNVDFWIIKLLDNDADEEGCFYQAFKKHLEERHMADERIPTIDAITERDPILLSSNKNDADNLLFEKVLNWFYTFSKDQTTIARECIDTITEWFLAEPCVPKVEALFNVIKDYLTSTYMDPDKAIAKLDGHPVFKALMKFLDFSDNDAFMDRGCDGLTQYERRYAYMMFAALKGMNAVEREWKSNVNLEHRLEQLALLKFKHNKLISAIPSGDQLKFCETGESLYGIQPAGTYWIGKRSTLKVFAGLGNEGKLRMLYELVKKDKRIKIDKLDRFETPCVVTVTCDDYSFKLEFDYMEDLKGTIKNKKIINDVGKKTKTVVDLDAFKKRYVLIDRWYSAVYEKHAAEIQTICEG